MGFPVLDTVLDIIKGPLDKLVPDKNERAKFEHAVTMAVLQSGHAQNEVNAKQAEHPSVFVAGGRPALQWIGAICIGYVYIGRDLLNWVLAVISMFTDQVIPELPMVNPELVFEIVLATLGMGGLRTYEKMKGVARSSWTKPSKGDGS